MLNKSFNPVSACGIKAKGEGVFTGYASVFDSNDLVGDTIKPGAFKGYTGNVIPLFINHDYGAVPVGSLKGAEDNHGFFVEASINLQHTDGPTVYSALKRGDVTGLSIGFSMGPDDYEKKQDGGREIHKLNLKEVSVVTWPCEPKAQITSVKSFDESETIRDLEKAIREEFGLSKSAACRFLSRVKSVIRGELEADLNKIEEQKFIKARVSALEQYLKSFEV